MWKIYPFIAVFYLPVEKLPTFILVIFWNVLKNWRVFLLKREKI